MNKIVKRILVILSSLLIFFIIAIGATIWFVFTPERITPVVNTQAQKLFTCEVEIGEVELTFFSTFPQFGLKVEKFILINPMDNAPSDTLVSADRLIGSIDIVALWKRDEVILTDISLLNGTVNAYIDSLGNNNFSVFVTDTTDTPEPDEPGLTLSFIDIDNIVLKNINLTYIDESFNLNTSFRNLHAEIKGTFIQENTKSDIKISESVVSFEHAGEKYLQNAAVQMTLPLQVFQSWELFELSKAQLAVNDLELLLDGSVRIDYSNWDIHSNLTYILHKSSLKDILELIPPSFQSYLEGIDAGGLVTSEGLIYGVINASSIPVMDMHIVMEEGYLNYPALLTPISNINGDINIYSDFSTDEISYLHINRLNARTPLSAFETQGQITNIFSDVYSRLTTNFNLNLGELNTMIPDTLNVKMNGRVEGSIKSGFSLSEIEKMQLEKMNISGYLTAYDLDATLDSMWVKTDISKVEFVMPNPDVSTRNTVFAHTKITTGNFEAGNPGYYHAFLQNANITLETSDLRDTTRVPDLMGSFMIDTIAASMDTIRFALKKPYGRVSIAPLIDKPGHPELRLTYNSDALEAYAGNNSVLINELLLDLDIVNDKSQTDVLQQWIVKGFMDVDQGLITENSLPYPIEIPAIKMDFDSEKLNINESRIIIDKSDFKLSGILDNVSSFLKGDSIMRGDFSFVSDNTDLLQLMALTSGLGAEEDKDAEGIEKNVSGETQKKVGNNYNDTTFTGPYMVPQRIDLMLSTNIRQVTFGNDTATDITGNVSVKDGILLLDDLRFTTSAARMQLTSMYRTPRKNHLYLGLDYHMFDIEIERLLEMIPDIDTLMPMLRSFKGKGEFHLAIESYLDSTYNIKKSTLRGASSIRGENLVLMDGETFSEIAKTLRFSKRAENRVDSLSAEFTIFREEIDIYPFLIVMDRYRAVVAGRHNFDMSFDYHITVVDSPLPTRLGIDINGDMDNLNFRLARTRYPELYRPASRGVVESRQLELRRMIRESLTERVSE